MSSESAGPPPPQKTSDRLAVTAAATPPGPTCFGRLDRLAKTNGEPLAWILEILPPS